MVGALYFVYDTLMVTEEAPPKVAVEEKKPPKSKKALERAAKAKAAAEAAAAAAAAPPRTVTVTVTKENFVILADTLFRFDKSAREDILPGGIQRLDDVVRRLKTYPSIQSMAIIGHTDRLGSDAYNQKLSQQRADAVKAYLVSNDGLDASRITAVGRSETAPVTQPGQCQGKAASTALIACLQPDRRVVVEVNGTR